MMFYLKKLISFFLSPLGIAFLLLLMTWYYTHQKNRDKKRLFMVLTLSWVFLISYQPFAVSLVNSIETKYEKLDTVPSGITHVLALGGDAKGRTYETLRLYHQDNNLTIVTSGYEPNGIDGAINTAKLLVESGIPKSAIVIKEKPRDTKEEAVMMKELVGDKPFILVTAAYHMPRAMALFKHAGLHPIAAPTNCLANSCAWLDILSISAMHRVDVAMHEFMGLLWYKVKGDL